MSEHSLSATDMWGFLATGDFNLLDRVGKSHVALRARVTALESERDVARLEARTLAMANDAKLDEINSIRTELAEATRASLHVGFLRGRVEKLEAALRPYVESYVAFLAGRSTYRGVTPRAAHDAAIAALSDAEPGKEVTT